jgi:uncharacterized iron-regulated membrane protein
MGVSGGTMRRLQRLLAPVHRWIGILGGLYFLLIALTGTALLFRTEIQQVQDPELFAVLGAGAPAATERLHERLREAYPQGDIVAIDSPTNRRPTTQAQVLLGRRSVTVQLDPVSASILGELPQRPLLRTLLRLHYDLTLGRTGRMVNGIGAILLTVLGLTGGILWWRGRRRWQEGLKVPLGQPAEPTNRALHDAVGIWATLALLMWGVTGAAYIYPYEVGQVIGWFSPIEAEEPPLVADPPPGAARLPLAAQMAAATQALPEKVVARVVFPGHPSVPLQVQFARASPTTAGERLESVYVDPWRGTLLPATAPDTAGQVVWNSFNLLHTGNFGGHGVRAVWLVLSLTPALLLVTGVTTWWLRRRRLARSRGR